MEADAVEIRVLGCLLEKQRATPDAYPLSLNALRLACNQATNRDPVVDYDEETVKDALRRLALRGWTRLASGPGSRAPKYRQLFEEAMGLEGGEAALVAVMMLRGPQTPGELKQRTERLGGFADLAAVQEALERLVESGRVERLARRPGQKEERYRQLFGVEAERAAEEAHAEVDEAYAPGSIEARLANVERQLAELHEALGISSPPEGDAEPEPAGGDQA